MGTLSTESCWFPPLRISSISSPNGLWDSSSAQRSMPHHPTAHWGNGRECLDLAPSSSCMHLSYTGPCSPLPYSSRWANGSNIRRGIVLSLQAVMDPTHNGNEHRKTNRWQMQALLKRMMSSPMNKSQDTIAHLAPNDVAIASSPHRCWIACSSEMPTAIGNHQYPRRCRNVHEQPHQHFPHYCLQLVFPLVGHEDLSFIKPRIATLKIHGRRDIRR